MRTLLRSWLGLAALALVAVGLSAAADDRKDAEKEKDPEKRSGTVVGTVTARGDNYLEVKAAGEEKGRRYVPRWVGGAPAQGGGFDKETLKAIKAIAVGSRVKLEWEFEERPRVVKVEVLKAPKPGKEKPKEKDKK